MRARVRIKAGPRLHRRLLLLLLLRRLVAESRARVSGGSGRGGSGGTTRRIPVARGSGRGRSGGWRPARVGIVLRGGRGRVLRLRRSPVIPGVVIVVDVEVVVDRLRRSRRGCRRRNRRGVRIHGGGGSAVHAFAVGGCGGGTVVRPDGTTRNLGFSSSRRERAILRGAAQDGRGRCLRLGRRCPGRRRRGGTGASGGSRRRNGSRALITGFRPRSHPARIASSRGRGRGRGRGRLGFGRRRSRAVRGWISVKVVRGSHLC
mmetsp:Transcript_2220/g.5943  ORF Transcript_2220/g.5943 Transcript_2220/m.5943 type:complete len:261 (+) Transcript_2220:983-1765(+)